MLSRNENTAVRSVNARVNAVERAAGLRVEFASWPPGEWPRRYGVTETI